MQAWPFSRNCAECRVKLIYWLFSYTTAIPMSPFLEIWGSLSQHPLLTGIFLLQCFFFFFNFDSFICELEAMTVKRSATGKRQTHARRLWSVSANRLYGLHKKTGCDWHWSLLGCTLELSPSLFFPPSTIPSHLVLPSPHHTTLPAPPLSLNTQGITGSPRSWIGSEESRFRPVGKS